MGSKFRWSWGAAALVLLWTSSTEPTHPGARPAAPTGAGLSQLAFSPNTGDFPAEVAFHARGREADVFLTQDEAVVAFRSGAPPLRLRWEGGAPAVPEGASRLRGVVNSFRGNDPAQWRTSVPTFAEVAYRGVYPGVDLVFTGRTGDVELELSVAPGADVDRVALVVDGARVHPSTEGALELVTPSRTLRLKAPEAWAGSRQVDARFVLGAAERIGFALGPHDRATPVLVDPVLEYSTYLGGLGADAINAVAHDSSGNIYVAGTTTSTNFPVKGALEGLDAGYDAFVAELNPSGSALVFSTFLGGNEDDSAHAVTVDADGGVYVVGSTSSTNFPTVAALQSTFAGEIDAFATKLAPGGGAIAYSTYLGSANEDFANAVVVDAQGDAFITGCAALSTFPTWRNFQTFKGGSWDAFLTELDPQGAGHNNTTFSTFVGGNNADCAQGLALDASGNIYLAGYTSSTNFPVISAIQNGLDGGQNGFVTEVAAGGQAFVFSTYLGGKSNDIVNGLALDASGDVYVAGKTASTNLPVTPGAVQPTLANGYDGFVAELAPGGHPVLALTYLGGSNVDGANGIAVGPGGLVYVCGTTGSPDFPALSSLQPHTGNSDAFLSVLEPGLGSFVYSTFVGGSSSQGASGMTLAANETVFMVGTTSSTDFPAGLPANPAFQAAYGTKSVPPDGGPEPSDGFLVRITQPAPLLTSAFPDGGPISGGTQVSLTGQNMLSGAVLFFGMADAGKGRWITSQNMNVSSPPHDAGAVDITLVNPDGQSATLTHAFLYWGPQAVITPNPLTVDAGDTFTLSGSQSTPSPGATLTGFQWSQPGGPSAVLLQSGASQTLAMGVPGDYTFALVVQDSQGQISPPGTGTVHVNGASAPLPTYRFGCGCGGGSEAPALLAALAAGLACRRRRARR